ncbi:hypothetical protein U8P73_35990 (plasmid) [Rhizobium beringeri]|uniref:hypothetical protein n=1 Tax=Rhizobium beringeri TaxID=3019934 RepID=UPI002DDD7675|nr:hypothetical protein [Rhizobium beringeri]WSG93553.1 hypothetical protein U8P73_35990 [Rhizobium beringeri]
MSDLERTDILTNYYVGSSLLSNWNSFPNNSLLIPANENLLASIGRFDALAGLDHDAWRKYYAVLVKIVITHVTAQGAYVAYVTLSDPESKADLIKLCKEHAARLDKCHFQISGYYAETVEEMWIESGGGPVNPKFKRVHGRVRIKGKRYSSSNGQRIIETEFVGSEELATRGYA